jgi:GH43 family beta-xylosidase
MGALIGTGFLLVSVACAAEPRFINPIVFQRADPWVLRHADGFYYLSATAPEYDRIELRRAKTLQGLGMAEARVIWRKHATGPMGAHIWAPELHHIDGRWYVYFAAGAAERVWDIRIYVLENAAANPLEGEWTEKGQIRTKWETFSLDATTFEHRGRRYLVWAQRDPSVRNNTDLYIAKMDTPWSIVGEPVMISRPEFDWETRRYKVNEAPAALIRNGRIFISFSASGTGAEYCMGLLAARDDADLLDPGSWAKSPLPVFATNADNRVFGPGHNGFTTVTTPDGELDVLIYHARSYEEIIGDPLRDPNRHTRAQIFHWRPDGTPDFGTPAADGPTPGPAAPATGGP